MGLGHTANPVWRGWERITSSASWIGFIVLLLPFLDVPGVSAMTITSHFIGGDAPANAAGGGNLTDIVNAAAHVWSLVYADPVEIDLYYGWAPVVDAGMHTVIEQGGQPNREISGMILFDNSGSALFYLDPTPNINEEYLEPTEAYQDLGGGPVNVARIYRHATGEAAGRVDLFSVALHEIGHALGFCAANTSFSVQSGAGVLTISGNYPFVGTVVPLAHNNAGTVPHFDGIGVAYGSVMSGINADERRLPSELDIVANAQVSGFTILSLYP
jgi:hypothetical protein